MQCQQCVLRATPITKALAVSHTSNIPYLLTSNAFSTLVVHWHSIHHSNGPMLQYNLKYLIPDMMKKSYDPEFFISHFFFFLNYKVKKMWAMWCIYHWPMVSLTARMLIWLSGSVTLRPMVWFNDIHRWTSTSLWYSTWLWVYQIYPQLIPKSTVDHKVDYTMYITF